MTAEKVSNVSRLYARKNTFSELTESIRSIEKETKKLTFKEAKGKDEVIGTLTKMLEEERASNRETQRLLLERVDQLEKTEALKVKQATSTKLQIDDQEKTMTMYRR